ncbi:hypothetical protein [Carnobacterium gallinarum]|uniref:hypothetical protein n=1 Tax=Carnobacterium gallinarum TaxID=2749 RepID=UPI000A5D23F9|nr:hypothetical protein [Carnobacterium gallinarum]
MKRTRFLCHQCGSTFSAKTSIVAPKDHLAASLKHQIALDLTENLSRKYIGQTRDVSGTTVVRILQSFNQKNALKSYFYPKFFV